MFSNQIHPDNEQAEMESAVYRFFRQNWRDTVDVEILIERAIIELDCDPELAGELAGQVAAERQKGIKMNLNDFINLTELLNNFRKEVDADYARRIEAAGWPNSKDIFIEGKEKLAQVDEMIEMVGIYQLNSPAGLAN